MKNKKLEIKRRAKNIPAQKNLGPAILEYLQDGKKHHATKILKFLEDHFDLSEDDRALKKSSGGEGLPNNRMRWAAFYLKKAGLVESKHGTGVSKITSEGLSLLKEKPSVIDAEFLMRYDVFAEYRNSMKKK